MLLKYLLAAALLVVIDTSSADETKNWEFRHKPITGEYGIYGGDVGDPLPSAKGNTKIAFSIRGKMAKEMFDAMGPDIKDVCTEGSGDRTREKDNDNLRCTRTGKGEYFCNFGFDLRTGKSIGGATC
jgi:hypothetical protein